MVVPFRGTVPGAVRDSTRAVTSDGWSEPRTMLRGLTLTVITQALVDGVGPGAGTWTGAVGVSVEQAGNSTSRAAAPASNALLRFSSSRLIATLLRLPHRARE